MNKIAKLLLEIRAVQINFKQPFTWASGVKSPVYIDNRIIGSFPSVRNIIYKQLAELIKQKFPHVEVLLGTATGGIIPAAFAAHYLNLPVGYVRQERKQHGAVKQIEGCFDSKQKVVVIEDLITTGNSVLHSVAAIQGQGMDVIGVVSIFSYSLKIAHHNFKSTQLDYASLVNLDDILQCLSDDENISPKDVRSIKDTITDIFAEKHLK